LIVAVSGLLVVGVGGWAAFTEFSGAVIASGQVMVESNVKKVQHPIGGVVGELHVRDGHPVQAGDILVRLDDIQSRANLAILTKARDELIARQARGEAERDGTVEIVFPPELHSRSSDPDVALAILGERLQFETRRRTREGQKAQLKERVAQLEREIDGYNAQIVAKLNQLEWIGKELTGIHELWQKKLVPYTRVTNLEREKERLDGERGQLIATIWQSRGKITETNLQILQIDQDMRAEVGRELTDMRARLSEIVEKKIAAEDQLRRIDVRSPQNGVVHQLGVHTIGGVVGPGEVIMLIVPESDALSIEVKVQPQDIDQVRVGQLAFVRLSAFNQQTTPELNGEVGRISADVSEDQKSGLRHYTVRITVPDSEVARLRGLRLLPGMPAEVFIQTSLRTVMSFLVRPLWDQIGRAFRET
jgi:HlyD family secretion protein